MFKKFAIPLLLVTALLLGACGAAAYSEPMLMADDGFGVNDIEIKALEMEGARAPLEAPDWTGNEEMLQQAGNDTAVTAAEDRLVIKDAYLKLSVADPAESLSAIIALAERLGGYVVNSSLYQTSTSMGVEVPQASVMVRVPADKLGEALDEIKAGATEVKSENITGRDITSEYTDLQSRLTNLQNAETQLAEIMANARDTEDVLAVFNQLTWIREQIEVLQGQIKYYDQAVAFSSINMELIADEANLPIDIGGWKPAGIAKDAIERLVHALQWLAETLIRFTISWLPILLILGLPLYFFTRYLARRRKAKKVAKAAAQAQE